MHAFDMLLIKDNLLAYFADSFVNIS